MVLAGIKVPDTVLVRDAIDLSRSASERFLFNHVMRSWLFGVLLSESAERAPDAELLAVATILHDLGLTDRYTAENRFEVRRDPSICGARSYRCPNVRDIKTSWCRRGNSVYVL